MHVCAAQKSLFNLYQIINKPDFPSLADEIAEPHPDMNIKVSAFTVSEKSSNIACHHSTLKAAYSVTMNIFRKNYFLLKSFVKVELSYVFTIKMFSTAENCMKKVNYLIK